MSEEKLSSLAILHMHKHKNVDIDNVVSEFSCRKGETSHPFPVETITANNTLIQTHLYTLLV